MEKTNAEIVILAMLLKDINIKAGTRKADCRPVIEKLDEHIDAFVKAAVEEGYAESEESHLPEVFPRADIRTAEFEEDIRGRIPGVAVPYGHRHPLPASRGLVP